MGLEERYRGEVAAYDALCIFCGGGERSDVEFVVPRGGPLADFNRGVGGLHHVAIAVPSLARIAASLAAKGISLLEREPVRGAGDFSCNFLSPQFTGSVVVEFIELDEPGRMR